MVSRAMSNANWRCSALLSTDGGICAQGTMASSSKSPNSKRPLSTHQTFVNSFSLSGLFNLRAMFCTDNFPKHIPSVPANTALEAACTSVDDTLCEVKKSVIAPQSETTMYLKPQSSRRICCKDACCHSKVHRPNADKHTSPDAHRHPAPTI